MKIDELTPEYICNKLEEHLNSKHAVDLSVENMDIKLIRKKIGRLNTVFLVERVSTDPKMGWDYVLYGRDFSKYHPDYFCIFNFFGWLTRDLKKKKDRKGCSERIVKEIICRYYGINYENKFLGEPSYTIEEIKQKCILLTN